MRVGVSRWAPNWQLVRHGAARRLKYGASQGRGSVAGYRASSDHQRDTGLKRIGGVIRIWESMSRLWLIRLRLKKEGVAEEIARQDSTFAQAQDFGIRNGPFTISMSFCTSAVISHRLVYTSYTKEFKSDDAEAGESLAD